MAWADDHAIAANGAITHVSGTTNYTWLEMHRALQDLADNASSIGDDNLDITDETPSERAYDNLITLNEPYYIDDTVARYHYDGSLVQKGGDEIYDGIVNYGTQGMHIEIMQNGALITPNFWTTGINADAAQGISHRFSVKTRVNGADIDGRRLIGMCREYENTYKEFVINGTSRGNNVLALEQTDDINNNTAAATVATWTGITLTEGYSGIDANGDGTDEYYFCEVDRSTYTINQMIERMKWLTRRGTSSTVFGLNGDLFRGITHEIDVDTPTGTFSAVEPVSWSTSGSITAFADAGDGKVTVTSAGHGRSNEDTVTITGTTNYNGTFIISNVTTNTFDIIDTWVSDDATGTWTHTFGTGQMLAIDSTTAPTKMWIQLLTGVAPTNNQVITGGTSSATCQMNTTITSRTIATPFCGVSTGSAIIGHYGFGVEAADLSASDRVTDLTNTQITPPNNVTFSVSNLIVGDRVLITNDDATSIDLDQLSLNATLSGASETSVVVTTSIPSDTPATGVIRVQTDSDKYVRCEYTSWTGSTFTITSTDFSTDNATAGNNVYIGYIDKTAASTTESFNCVYNADRTLFIRVRNGSGANPIKTFQSTSVLGTAGGSTAVIRTPDA